MSKPGLIESWLVRKLVKVGRSGSYSITLPINIVRDFGWSEHQKMQITVDRDNKRLIISDWEG